MTKKSQGKKVFIITFMILAILFCLDIPVFADGGGDEFIDYDSSGVAAKLEGRVIMKGSRSSKPVLLKEGALIECYATLETKDGSSLYLQLGPEVARGSDYMSNIQLGSNTEIEGDFKLPTSYQDTQYWWEDDAYWIDNEITYKYKILSGKIETNLNANFFECVKDFKYEFMKYTIMPSAEGSDKIDFDIEIVKDGEYEKDFDLFDVYSMKLILDIQLQEMGAASIDDLNEEQKEIIDMIKSSYEMMFKYKKFDVMNITVRSGKVKILYNDNQDVAEIEAGESARFTDVPN